MTRQNDIPSSVPSLKMTSFDTYNAKTTSISYPWPAGVTGVERIALSAHGDLQRVLSAFFSRPIVIALVYSHTLHQTSPNSSPEPLTLPNPQVIASASATSPITQTRQVHLQCGGKIACTATSIVRITSPDIAHLFLEEKYAIGQMFRRLEKVPAFELLSVGIGPVKSSDKEHAHLAPRSSTQERNQLWRKYKLVIPDFECEILEVFPCRAMFTDSEAWLKGEPMQDPPAAIKDGEISFTIRLSRLQHGFLLIFVLTALFVAGIEGMLLYLGRPVNCRRALA
ncbi:hypothetical protein CC1G_05757 [Coprinopsis cinerea okayama7|uniref:Uncharacterized protein n=1 Tax=Coprinopsis cinerea (strain Okayama-7 / 130 / ATCC MYA-4618 / FGSC 9003) TaxID=240176 RepID=A8NA30_COPC7|nr:hypothetical protein CC1G_05757 [Coprinopsis cinerea okayama7\|eukprot:XP_001831686.2 hypothetical protein CC1G_05757 [Coprinopsis cinerea okayama7\